MSRSGTESADLKYLLLKNALAALARLPLGGEALAIGLPDKLRAHRQAIIDELSVPGRSAGDVVKDYLINISEADSEALYQEVNAVSAASMAALQAELNQRSELIVPLLDLNQAMRVVFSEDLEEASQLSSELQDEYEALTQEAIRHEGLNLDAEQAEFGRLKASLNGHLDVIKTSSNAASERIGSDLPYSELVAAIAKTNKLIAELKATKFAEIKDAEKPDLFYKVYLAINEAIDGRALLEEAIRKAHPAEEPIRVSLESMNQEAIAMRVFLEAMGAKIDAAPLRAVSADVIAIPANATSLLPLPPTPTAADATPAYTPTDDADATPAADATPTGDAAPAPIFYVDPNIALARPTATRAVTPPTPAPVSPRTEVGAAPAVSPSNSEGSGASLNPSAFQGRVGSGRSEAVDASAKPVVHHFGNYEVPVPENPSLVGAHGGAQHLTRMSSSVSAEASGDAAHSPHGNEASTPKATETALTLAELAELPKARKVYVDKIVKQSWSSEAHPHWMLKLKRALFYGFYVLFSKDAHEALGKSPRSKTLQIAIEYFAVLTFPFQALLYPFVYGIGKFLSAAFGHKNLRNSFVRFLGLAAGGVAGYFIFLQLSALAVGLVIPGVNIAIAVVAVTVLASLLASSLVIALSTVLVETPMDVALVNRRANAMAKRYGITSKADRSVATQFFKFTQGVRQDLKQALYLPSEKGDAEVPDNAPGVYETPVKVYAPHQDPFLGMYVQLGDLESTVGAAPDLKKDVTLLLVLFKTAVDHPANVGETAALKASAGVSESYGSNLGKGASLARTPSPSDAATAARTDAATLVGIPVAHAAAGAAVAPMAGGESAAVTGDVPVVSSVLTTPHRRA